MRDNIVGATWRFAIFIVVCSLAIFVLFVIFAQLRFDDKNVYYADFGNVSGLKSGDFVRIAGVEVGKVRSIRFNGDTALGVEFSADQSVVLTKGSRAIVRYDNLIGDRYLALEDGAGDTTTLVPGQTIPMSNTAPALDLDALIGGFRPLFRALDPDKVNQLSSELIDAFQGQGATLGSFLSQTAAVTGTLADRDELIGQVITNLNTVLGSLGDKSDQVDKTVTSLSDLIAGLESRKSDISNSLGYLNDAAGTVADLLSQARSPLKEAVKQTDRTAGAVLADRDYLDNLLDSLPEKYKLIGRQGLYGDYFSFYLCDAVLKLNGKHGEPVYVKVAGQDTGRCAHK